MEQFVFDIATLEEASLLESLKLGRFLDAEDFVK